jgi:RNA-directed DNA polymerase
VKKRPNELPLKDCYLYAISSPADLGRRLSPERPIQPDVLQKFAMDAGNFKLFKIGAIDKQRAVQEPKAALQGIHKRVHRLLGRVAVPDYLHSTVRGRSYVSNARVHDGAEAAIKIDVKKFFSSVKRVAVFRFFSNQLACRPDVAGLLADMLTFDGHLATGSSASPILAYYCYKAMFDELAALALRHGLKMTVYVDDITMSGAGAGKAVLAEAHRIIATYGLRSHKMKRFNLNEPRVITGVCNTANGPRVPNRLHLNIKADFDKLDSVKSTKDRNKAVSRIRGRLHAAGQIDPAFKARAKTFDTAIRSGTI